jgi:Ala-tRNA(Pro) deacylase
MEGSSTMATATWIKDMLAERGVTFEEEQHREAFTAQEVAQSEHVSGHRLAKVVVIVADSRPIELVVPASRRVILEEVQRLLGASRVRLASEAEMDQIFGDIETGAIPALRHWKDVEVVMDESMKVDGEIVLHGGTHRDTIRLRYTDWYDMVKPKVGVFTELENRAGNRPFTDREDPGIGA